MSSGVFFIRFLFFLFYDEARRDFEEEPGRTSAAKLLSKDEARRIAVHFATLSLGLWARPFARRGCVTLPSVMA